MTRIIYNFLILLLFPIWFVWMILRVRNRTNSPNWKERWGNYPDIIGEKGNRIWFHAVSVGEVFAAKPILERLRILLPEVSFVLTTTTSTGNEVAKSLIGTSIDQLLYFPIDVPWAAKKAFHKISPTLFVVLETELWLNCLHESKNINAANYLINARLSDHSYKSSLKVKFFYRAIFKLLDRILAQTAEDAKRFISLGGKNTEVFGNSKFDEPISNSSSLPIDEGYILIGSARGDFEEDFILNALSGIDDRIIFAPRHIERSKQIHEKARAKGFQVGLRSEDEWNKNFLILDSYGELSSLYQNAKVAIIGGGFDNLGGQNIIQPLSVGCPVICGPNMKNFREPFQMALKAGAILVAESPGNLRTHLEVLLANEQLRQDMGTKGKMLIEQNRGVAERYAQAIASAFREKNP